MTGLKAKHGLAVDVIDPHHIELADAPAKSAFAKYAAKHHADYRIELIIVRRSDEVRRRPH